MAAKTQIRQIHRERVFLKEYKKAQEAEQKAAIEAEVARNSYPRKGFPNSRPYEIHFYSFYPIIVKHKGETRGHNFLTQQDSKLLLEDRICYNFLENWNLEELVFFLQRVSQNVFLAV